MKQVIKDYFHYRKIGLTPVNSWKHATRLYDNRRAAMERTANNTKA